MHQSVLVSLTFFNTTIFQSRKKLWLPITVGPFVPVDLEWNAPDDFYNMVHSWRAATTTGKQQGNLAMSKMSSYSHGCRYYIGVKSVCHILSSQMLGRPYVPDEKWYITFKIIQPFLEKKIGAISQPQTQITAAKLRCTTLPFLEPPCCRSGPVSDLCPVRFWRRYYPVEGSSP